MLYNAELAYNTSGAGQCQKYTLSQENPRIMLANDLDKTGVLHTIYLVVLQILMEAI